MQPQRLGVIGPGLIWEKAHRPAITKLHDSFVPTAFSARSEGTRQKVAEQYPHCSFYFDYTELIRSPDVDGVVVLTPISMNAPVAMEVLAAGKHVFLEKPMAVSTDEAEKLIEAERASGKQVFVLEQVVYSPELTAIQAAIDAGEIGTPICFERADHVFMDEKADQTGGYGGTAWRQNAEFPLGLIFDAGIHALAQLSTLFGRPESLHARGVKLREEYGEYDQELVLLSYQNNVSGSYNHSGILGSMDNYTIIRGTEGAIARHGSDPWRIVYKRGGDKQLPVETARNDHDAMWEHFAGCLERGDAPRYTTTRSLDEFHTFDAIAESLKSGTVVSLTR